MRKIVCLYDVNLDEKTAKKKAEGYKQVARKPKAMYSEKANCWYVCLTEVEDNKVEQARYYFQTKGLQVVVLENE